MIQLTEQQRVELSAAEPTAIDSRTQETYVLLRREAYDHLKSLLALEQYDPDEKAALVQEVAAQDDADDPWMETFQQARCWMQIRDGRRLLELLRRERLPVTAAAWVKESEGGPCFFHLVTRLVTKKGGALPAYRRLCPVFRQMPQPFWVDPMEFKVVAPSSAVGKAICDIAGSRPGPVPVPWGSIRVGGLSVDGAYVYPAVGAAVG